MQSNRSSVPQSHRATVEQPDRAIPARGYRFVTRTDSQTVSRSPLVRFQHRREHGTSPLDENTVRADSRGHGKRANLSASS